MDLNLSLLPIGTSVSLVARVLDQTVDGITECTGISPTQSFSLAPSPVLTEGIFSFYQLVKLSSDPLLLGFCDHSACYPKTVHAPFRKMAIYDVCSGMGGFSMGTSPLGADTVAFLECNELACDHLRANFTAPVLQGSVEDVQCIKEMHSLKPDAFIQVTGGFPCQPYSRQGDMQGLRDKRGQILPAILRCSWLRQASALLLECVETVQEFDDIQDLMHQYATMAHMTLSKIVFDLRSQWPVRRCRFWCLMLDADLPPLHLQAWPSCLHCTTLGDVMPFDALWPDEHELDLLWTDQECALFFDPRYGSDLRVLQHSHQAPTMLHSCANLLQACPCGCRTRPFTHHRLLQGGARGFGLISAKTMKIRHLHPEEGALLCTVPLNYTYLGSARDALCLLGQIAAPLQVLWLQSQLMAHLQTNFWLSSSINALEMVQQYKYSLLQQRAQRWVLQCMSMPRTIHLQMDQVMHNITVNSPVTVRELEQAESKLAGHGFYVVVTQAQHRLPPWCQLHAGATYQLHLLTKKNAKLYAEHPTSLLGEGTQLMGCATHLRSSLAGLGDTHVWKGMRMLLDLMSKTGHLDLPMIQYPFRATHLLRRQLPPAVLHDWQQRFSHSNGRICIIYEHAGHWTFLTGVRHDQIHWTHFDGLDSKPNSKSLRLAGAIAEEITTCLDHEMGNCNAGTSIPQLCSFSCGTIALLNMAHQLRVQQHLQYEDECALHNFFLNNCHEPSGFQAMGKGSQVDTLAQLLIAKGVLEANASERAQQVIDKLGQAQVQQIMKNVNPWPSLKAAASKPGRMFRLVTEEEQQAYIAKRAQTKHGAKVQNPKQKKHASLGRDSQMMLDPALFRLDPNHFQDDDGQPVPQLQFADVEANQNGIALCTTYMAKRFLENPDSISMQGLALLLIDQPAPALIQKTGMTPMIFPAWCTTTEEHTIIMGHILQLGDSKIKRKMAGTESKPDTIETRVVKLQVYKDQFEADWASFSAAPVRCLLNMIEAMQLCRGQQCGVDCAKYHPGLDENLDGVILEVWSRSFLNDMGKRVEPSQADLFTVFLRLPESAVGRILASTPAGIYMEPRGTHPREPDDKYSVVWLPGASAAEAIHQCRTFAKSVCLVRMKHKYGIRVRKQDESIAWTKLRPGVEFIDMSIQKIYELFPLPHGTQRQAITQILSDWEWKARVLQPGKGNQHHMAWRIGSADPPPASILTAFGADVIITAVKDLQINTPKPQIFASAKTQQHLREPGSRSTMAKASTSVDPWLAEDPWGGYAKTTTGPNSSKTHREVLQEHLREDILTVIKEERAKKQEDMNVDQGDQYTTENELRFAHLESGLSELKQQNGHFMQWFQQTGDRLKQTESMMQEGQDNVNQHAGAIQQLTGSVQNTEKAIGEVHNTLNVHQQELHSIGTNFKAAIKSMKDEISDDMMNSFNQQYGNLKLS